MESFDAPELSDQVSYHVHLDRFEHETGNVVFTQIGGDARTFSFTIDLAKEKKLAEVLFAAVHHDTRALSILVSEAKNGATPSLLRVEIPQRDQRIDPPGRPPVVDTSEDEVFLRGWDGQVAVFARRKGQEFEEFEVAVKPNPLFARQYQLLMDASAHDGRVPALHIRIKTPPEGVDGMPELLMIAPASERTDPKFKHPGDPSYELTWTERLDEAVDVDFDWKAQLFAMEKLRDSLGSENKEVWASVRAEAETIAQRTAKELGLSLTSDQLTSAFSSYAPADMQAVMSGQEGALSVRYETLKPLSLQCAHAQSDQQKIQAVINYSFQAGAVESIAKEAAFKQRVKGADGVTVIDGSLAEAHQQNLVDNNKLMAANPTLSSHREAFVMYSHEITRRNASYALSGMMDIAGIKSARPDIDVIEYEKRHRSIDDSQHLRAIANMPEDALKGSLGERMAAYIGAREVETQNQVVATELEVTTASLAATPKRDPKHITRSSRIGDGITEILQKAERMLDMSPI